MSANLFNLIHRGYFPKELPIPFTTYTLALRWDKVWQQWQDRINRPHTFIPKSVGEADDEYQKRIRNEAKKWKSRASTATRYSIRKGVLTRRFLEIPNPINFIPLAKEVLDNLIDINAVCQLSPFSESKPTYMGLIENRCFEPNSKSVADYQKLKLKLGMTKRVEVNLDIQNFYPTIYTHSLSWALIGKTKAKEVWRYKNNNTLPAPLQNDLNLYDIADKIDKELCKGQDLQTHGIPVGPDISFILAEMILSRIDVEIKKEFPQVEGCRYYDDYSFYVDSKEKASDILKFIQMKLYDYGLELNENKIIVKEAPAPFLEEHTQELSPFNFTNNPYGQARALKLYFNLLWKFAELRPSKIGMIFKYGLQTLIGKSVQIDIANRPLFESLLYKTIIADPSIISLACELLNAHGFSPDRGSLTRLTRAIFDKHIELEQHFEVSWAIWICKQYKLDIKKKNVVSILRMGNPICTLLLLDYLHNISSLLLNDRTISNAILEVEKSLSIGSLYTSDWLLMYEGTKHGWLNMSKEINVDPFFSILMDNDISFYDENPIANYKSYHYILSLPYENPHDVEDSVNRYKEHIMEEIRRRELVRRADDIIVPWEEADENNLSADIEEELNELDVESTLFDRLRLMVFRDEPVNEEDIINEMLARIDAMHRY